MMRTRGRPVRLGIPLLVLAVAVLSIAAAPRFGKVLPLRADGIAIRADGGAFTVPANSGAAYHPGGSVLSTVDPRAPAVQEAAALEQAWFGAGDPPRERYADMAERALLDIRLLTSPEGALMGAPVTMWRFVWPRDASFAAAALAAAGYHDDAAAILGFLADVAPGDGLWEARYRRDGSGPVLDGRAPQMDGAGWVSWATWMAVETAPTLDYARDLVETMAPAVIPSADAIASFVGADGLPAPSSDYWEQEETEATLATAGASSLGLRSAVALAPMLGVDPGPWWEAERRLAGAITREFGAHGYPRTVPDGGLDAAVSFLAPPFAPPDYAVRRAVVETEKALRVPNGGHKPGEAWSVDVNVAWTPETAMLALALAGSDETARAVKLLGFLDENRTSLGALPEKIDARGLPASVAPLPITGALVVLALVELERGLPVLPAAS